MEIFNCGGIGMRESNVAGSQGNKREACNREEETREGCMQWEWGREAAPGASLSSHPLPRRQIQILSTATVEWSMESERSRSLPYQTPVFPVQGRGRREKKGQGSEWHSKTFFNEKTLAWRWGSCPRLVGLPMWAGSQRRLPLTWW